MKTRFVLRESPVMKLGDKRTGDRHIVSNLKMRKMFWQEREGSSCGAKYNGHLLDTTYSGRRRAGEIHIGSKMSMQMTERWTIYRDLSWLQECYSDI